ncbi:MAG: hypothetical protein L0170_19590, partial [Acidobacteria bacterium]|nr:hypothetical protein [Acidobacteriota bacterium]
TGIFVGVHLITGVVLWPSASMMALVIDQWIGPASWPRLWLAGVIAVPVVWIGTLLCGQLSEPVIRELCSVLGWWAGLLNYYCWAVLFSNLTLLIACVRRTSLPARRP